MDPLHTILLLILLAPLVAAVLAVLIIFFCPDRDEEAVPAGLSPRQQSWVQLQRLGSRSVAYLSVGASLFAAILTVAVLMFWDPDLPGMRPTSSVEWMRLGDFSVSLGFHFDHLVATMLFVVTFVGFWIHFFSLGYMRADPAKARYFGGLSVFLFSMLGIVLAGNLFMLFIFWELVGFSSYLLIDHYYEKPAAAAASKKAFIVNRVGDFGFLIGIVWCYHHFGTVDLAELAATVNLVELVAAAEPSLAVREELLVTTGIGLCLFCGVLGKSAQMPLHVWLPDAMEGPTPVSALIHAATMVAAGVYFLCRTYFLFTPEALTVITWCGVITALYAAICAFSVRDIKRILAFSTLSQLGFMVAGFGLGTAYGLATGGSAIKYGLAVAMFHLTTHAFFKALLFLGAGSVIDACHHEQDIFRMGGLRRRMPTTFWTFTVGVFAIAGVPLLFAGFWSKDAIFWVANEQNTVAFGVLVFSALLTAAYMGRLWLVAFFGEAKSEAAAGAVESPPEMLWPLRVLAFLAVIGGWTWAYPGTIEPLWHLLPHPDDTEFAFMIVFSAMLSLGGLWGARIYYRPGASLDRLARNRPVFFGNLAGLRTWFDDLYAAYVSRVQQRVAEALDLFDQIFISGLMVRGAAGAAGLVGLVARSVHVGSIHAYVFWFLAGLLIFGLYALAWSG